MERFSYSQSYASNVYLSRLVYLILAVKKEKWQSISVGPWWVYCWQINSARSPPRTLNLINLSRLDYEATGSLNWSQHFRRQSNTSRGSQLYIGSAKSRSKTSFQETIGKINDPHWIPNILSLVTWKRKDCQFPLEYPSKKKKKSFSRAGPIYKNQ